MLFYKWLILRSTFESSSFKDKPSNNVQGCSLINLLKPFQDMQGTWIHWGSPGSCLLQRPREPYWVSGAGSLDHFGSLATGGLQQCCHSECLWPPLSEWVLATFPTQSCRSSSIPARCNFPLVLVFFFFWINIFAWLIKFITSAISCSVNKSLLKTHYWMFNNNIIKSIKRLS